MDILAKAIESNITGRRDVPEIISAVENGKTVIISIERISPAEFRVRTVSGNNVTTRTVELTGIIESIIKSPTTTTATSYDLLARTALMVKEAGTFQGNFVLPFDCRSGGLNAALMLSGITDAIDRVPNAPARYLIMVDAGTNLIVDPKYKDKITVIEIDPSISKDDNRVAEAMMAEMAGLGLRNAIYAAVATTESNSGFLMAHYQARANSKDGCVNAFISKNGLVVSKEDHDKTRLAAFISVMMRLASQDKTTIIAADCDKHLIKDLEDMFKGIAFNLIRITKLDIDALVRKILTAMTATERSL